MTKLEELKAAYHAAYEAVLDALVDVGADYAAAEAEYATAYIAHRAELNKTQRIYHV
jgi:hypothetical protein